MLFRSSGSATPTDQEMLISFILQEEIKRKTTSRQAMRKKFEEANAVIAGRDDFGI